MAHPVLPRRRADENYLFRNYIFFCQFCISWQREYNLENRRYSHDSKSCNFADILWTALAIDCSTHNPIFLWGGGGEKYPPAEKVAPICNHQKCSIVCLRNELFPCLFSRPAHTPPYPYPHLSFVKAMVSCYHAKR